MGDLFVTAVLQPDAPFLSQIQFREQGLSQQQVTSWL